MERDKIIRVLEWLEWLKSNTRYSDEAEIELTISLIHELTEEIKDLEADYDRVYEQAEADIHGNMADGGTSCHWCAEKTKADTVKRMQIMFKERLDISTCGYSTVEVVSDVLETLDRVAEEVLEEIR